MRYWPINQNWVMPCNEGSRLAMTSDPLAEVRRAAEAKPDDPIYRLVLSMIGDCATHLEYGIAARKLDAAIARCAEEIRGEK